MTTHDQYPGRLAAVGIVFISILLPYFFAAFFISPQGGTIPDSARIYIFIGEIFIIVPSAVYVFRKQFSIKRVYRLKSVSSPAVLWSLVIGISISTLGDEFDRLISMVIEPPDWLAESLAFFQINSFGEFLLIVGALVIITPVAEELLFRGFLQTTLEYRTQDVTKSVLITALAFALLHMNTWWIIQIYLFGVALSYLSWRTQSVVPGIAAHMGINGLSLIFSNLEPSQLGWYEMGNHVSVIWLGLAGAGVFYGFREINRMFSLADRQSRTIIPAESAQDTSETKPE